MTHRVHDQRLTGLCTSFSTVSTLRAATIRFMVNNHGINRDQVRGDLEIRGGQYSFEKMLTLFTGCVSLRSMDGIILNSQNDPRLIGSQAQPRDSAVDRLVRKTAIQEEGWLRITPLVELFRNYNLNPQMIELVTFRVYHPRHTPPNERSYLDLLSRVFRHAKKSFSGIKGFFSFFYCQNFKNRTVRYESYPAFLKIVPRSIINVSLKVSKKNFKR